MSRFTGPIRIELLEARSRTGRLLEPLVWECHHEGSGREVVVPAGFESDGVTAPRLLWWLLPPWGHGATRAAILHDYGLARLRDGDPHPYLPNRAAIDREFRLALRATGVTAWLRWAIWLSVRVYGALRRPRPHATLPSRTPPDGPARLDADDASR